MFLFIFITYIGIIQHHKTNYFHQWYNLNHRPCSITKIVVICLLSYYKNHWFLYKVLSPVILSSDKLWSSKNIILCSAFIIQQYNSFFAIGLLFLRLFLEISSSRRLSTSVIKCIRICCITLWCAVVLGTQMWWAIVKQKPTFY